MRAIVGYGAAALAIVVAGCGSDGSDPAAANQSADAGKAAASFCTFTAGDTRDWKASIAAAAGKDGAPAPLIVTGQARVWGEGYGPRLIEPDSQPPTLRLLLTKAEDRSPAPTDGFRDLTFELPNPGNIETVVIWCDRETELATIKVERAG